VYKEAQPPKSAVDLLNRARHFQIGNDYYETSREDRETALNLLMAALELSRASDDLLSQVECLKDIARIYDMNVEYPIAASYLEQALEICLKLENPELILQANCKLANIYYVLSDYPNAMAYCREQIRLASALNKFGDECYGYCTLAFCCEAIGRIEEARNSYQYGVDMALAHRDVVNPTTIVSNYTVFLSEHAMVEDLPRYLELLLEFTSSPKIRDQIVVADGIAAAYNVLGRYEESIAVSQNAIDLCIKVKDLYGESEAQIDLGEAHSRLGHLDEARAAFERALELAKIVGENTKSASIASQVLAEVLEKQGDFRRALFHVKRFHEIDAKLFQDAADNKMQALMAEMQVERAKQDAEIHRLRTVELTELNSALENANVLLHEQNEELEAQASQLQAQAVALERLSTIDALTALYNRRYLEEWLARQFAQARRHREDFAVAPAVCPSPASSRGLRRCPRRCRPFQEHQRPLRTCRRRQSAHDNRQNPHRGLSSGRPRRALRRRRVRGGDAAREGRRSIFHV
jgi:tetratricopeptide (TPR) repeat protein